MKKAKITKGPREGTIGKVLNAYYSPKSRTYLANLMLDDKSKVMVPVDNLAIIEDEKPKPIPNQRHVGEVYGQREGRGGSRNMKSAKNEVQGTPTKVSNKSGVIRICHRCGRKYDEGTRRGQPGLISHCMYCAEETVEKYSGVMIFSHKTAPEIEIKQGEKLIKEATGLYKRRD